MPAFHWACCCGEPGSTLYYPLFFCPDGTEYTGYLLSQGRAFGHFEGDTLSVTLDSGERFCAVMGPLSAEYSGNVIANGASSITTDFTDDCGTCCDCEDAPPTAVAVSIPIPAPCSVTVGLTLASGSTTPFPHGSCGGYKGGVTRNCGESVVDDTIDAWVLYENPLGNELPATCFFMLYVEWTHYVDNELGTSGTLNAGYYVKFATDPRGVYTYLSGFSFAATLTVS